VTSFVWERDTADAWNEPYEYEGQEQFQREADSVIGILKEHYSKKDMTFDRDETSLEKAIWLIQVDALEALSDALILTKEKRHRIASRLLRDTMETMDLSAYFYLSGEKAKSNLDKWYKDEVIPHRIFRAFIRNHECEDNAKKLGDLYSDLSKYTHRTHNSIIKSYLLGREDKIAYDGFTKNGSRVLPHVISFSYAAIAALIKRFVDVSLSTNQISISQVNNMWSVAMEKEIVKRRFGFEPGQIIRGEPIAIDLETKS